ALVQLFIALLLVPSLHVQLVMFVVYPMAQTCLYALQFAYIIMCFLAEPYGTLQAFLASVSFSFGLLNYVLNPWMQLYFDGNYTVGVNITQCHTKAKTESVRDSLDENTKILSI
ncbi:hypothetical protein DVH05_010652, partial [Phytophthora capsici]